MKYTLKHAEKIMTGSVEDAFSSKACAIFCFEMPDVKAARELNQGHYRKKDVFVNPASNRFRKSVILSRIVLNIFFCTAHSL